MFKIRWDKETGGVLLSSKVLPDTLGVSPRPVFFEELDLLQLDKLGWKYPHSTEPLMWCCNKSYYYHGDLMFEAKGANVYDPATVVFQEGKEKSDLKPVNVAKMLERCKNEMFLLETEAIEFIRDVYVQYTDASRKTESIPTNQIDFETLVARVSKERKQQMAIVKQDCDSFDIMPMDDAKQAGKRTYATTKIDKFLASFSGGKDSQVVLDLCTRAIPPQDFEVIYSDTGYELPPSLELYAQVKEHYQTLYPELSFRIARNHESVLNYWDKIGTPSDTHRWCCSVMKTAPLYRMLKVDGTNKQAKVLAFNGERAEESVQRSKYLRIGKGKHGTIIEALPILYWNTTEIFLYLLSHKLLINKAYRQGMTRVGCLYCPFSALWNDMISATCYPSNLKPFLSRVESIVNKAGIVDAKDYIKEGNWKRRAGGRGLSFPSSMEIIPNKKELTIKCISPQKDVLTWLNAVDKYSVFRENNNIIVELLHQKEIIKFLITKEKNAYIFKFDLTNISSTIIGLIKRALYKATYCINCETCEIECPTGALSILPDVKIDNQKCTHCHKCLGFHDFGCIVANSLAITENSRNKMKLISYNNFGLNGQWLDFYMSSPKTYFVDNMHGLHPKEQLPNFVKWLVQAEILDDTKTKNITDFGNLLSSIYIDMPDLVWQIIWINLSYNSPIAKWYKENVEWHFQFTENDIREMVKNDYPNDSQTTIKNIVYALFRTFRESPIGEMGLLQEIEKLRYKKDGFSVLSREVIAYSLYKFAETQGIKTFRVSDLYNEECKSGPFREFGISKTDLEKTLRSLNSDTNRVLTAELNMGLDHITLRDDLNALSALEILTK